MPVQCVEGRKLKVSLGPQYGKIEMVYWSNVPWFPVSRMGHSRRGDGPEREADPWCEGLSPGGSKWLW